MRGIANQINTWTLEMMHKLKDLWACGGGLTSMQIKDLAERRHYWDLCT